MRCHSHAESPKSQDTLKSFNVLAMLHHLREIILNRQITSKFRTLNKAHKIIYISSCVSTSLLKNNYSSDFRQVLTYDCGAYEKKKNIVSLIRDYFIYPPLNSIGLCVALQKIRNEKLKKHTKKKSETKNKTKK